MYMPYLRGKQFELIALRELASEIAASKLISPIIEPVRIETAGLERAIELLIKHSINFTLIINPSVGELIGRSSRVLDFIKQKLSVYKNFQIGIIIDNDDSVSISSKLIEQSELGDGYSYALIHNYIPVNREQVSEFVQEYDVKYNVINFNKVASRRYHRDFNKDTIVTLEDKFITRNKNSDYALTPDELFSEEQLYYKDEGFVAFSDFLAIGEPYSETGFLPYAVAIHITYPIPDKRIRIHHFVSDSNEDTIDVPGKFDEALEKLIAFITNINLNTKACKEFKALHEKEHYPGLGSIKKLSIMNHIEVVIDLIKV